MPTNIKGLPEISHDPDVFTVVVRDRVFKLSRPQIGCDSPNYFTSRFFDSLGQRKIQVLEIARDPFLFELVLRYLNGYRVLPIHPGLVPPYCTPETALVDLCTDAEFYQLEGLRRMCSLRPDLSNKLTTSILRTPEDTSQLLVRYAAVTGHVYTLADKFQLAETFDECTPRFTITLLNETRYKAATSGNFFISIMEDKLSNQLPDLLVVMGWSERIARTVVQRDTIGVDRWELMGWKRDVSDNLRHVALLIKMWVEPRFEIVH